MEKVFLDCGGNIGQSVVKFMRSKIYDGSFLIHSFEPVEVLAKNYKDMKGITYHNKAIWIFDGEIQFFLDINTKKPMGSTLFSKKKSKGLDRKNPVNVPCIDFGKWVKNNFSKDDFIILKMDIEGAEYEVLNKMIDDDSINYIDEMYIEWHHHKIGISKEEHLKLLDRLNSIKTLKVFPEFGKVM